MFNTTDVMFIPQFIRCPICANEYSPLFLLERLILPESTFQCLACNYTFTKEYVGKFFGVIKDVRMEKE